ncbi:MAG: hypothetical protein MZV49_15530 [Rhodopseudomonas palustris]|nr:hypothetical protein [Rhodopseudomonas palustris]
MVRRGGRPPGGPGRRGGLHRHPTGCPQGLHPDGRRGRQARVCREADGHARR